MTEPDTSEKVVPRETLPEPTRTVPALAAGAAITPIIPTSVEEVQRLANIILASGLAPRGLDSMAQIVVVIMAGLEVGLPPIQAMQSIALINGRPSLYGDGMLAVVRRSGLLDQITETLKEGDGVNGLPEGETVATCRVRRKGALNSITRKFSITDAKVAGLWGKRGRDGQATPWVTYPKRMLAMRARAFALRDGFADVLRGMASAEEQMDIPVGETPTGRVDVPAPPPDPDAVIWDEHDERAVRPDD